jgi:hypothetical protein
VREIASRYDSFFDASGYVQDVRSVVYTLYQQVAAMRATVSVRRSCASNGQRRSAAGSMRLQSSCICECSCLQFVVLQCAWEAIPAPPPHHCFCLERRWISITSI